MRNPRVYILHEGQRVYTKGAQEYFEYSCEHCAKEVPESDLYSLNGSLTHNGFHGFGPDPEKPYENAPLHEDCVLSYVAAKLAAIADISDTSDSAT